MAETSIPNPAAVRLLYIAGAVLLLGFIALGVIGSSRGIGSLDANGIIYVVNHRIATGEGAISRPPGHPLSEYWVLPTSMRILPGNHVLTPFLYGIYQLKGGVLCLVMFWFLLGEIAVTLPRRILATACLAFSPQVLITSSDGEEFLWAMSLVFLSILIVAKLSRGALRKPLGWWCAAVIAAVAASGYRIEYGAVGLLVVFGTLLFSDVCWWRRFCLAGIAAVLFAVIWLPVLLHHIDPPYANPLNWKTRLGVGGYKIGFHAIGVVPLLIGLIFLFQSRSQLRILPPFGQGILGYWALWLFVIFSALFFVYPTKILEVLPGIAVLILLGAAYGDRATWAVFVVACMSVMLIHLDCFQDRKFVGLKIEPSLWAQNLAEKPAALLPQVEAATRVATTGRHVLVSDVWPWGLAWQEEHAGWPGIPEPRADQSGHHEAYRVGPAIVTSRNILDNNVAVLKSYLADGYDLWVDASLYREMYMRYDLTSPTPETAVVEGLPCRVVEVK